MKPQDLISDEYRKILEEYHSNAKSWGRNADKRMAFVISICEEHEATHVLDYGAGKGALSEKADKISKKAGTTNIEITSYEPGIPENAHLPKSHDIVVSFAALEHVEPEKIDNVLSHIRSLTKKIAYLDIGVTRARHTLPNGQNAHLIVENKEWWTKRLERAGFNVINVEPNFDEDGDPFIKLNRARGKGCIMFTCVPV